MRLGVDVGGTFTDLLLYDDATKRVFRAKTPSTPEDQSIGILAGIEAISTLAGISADQIEVLLHGTTVATNAVLEGRGARVGLLATEGFEYTLHLAKSWTPGPLFGWIIMEKPEPLASLDDTRAVRERIDARGNVVVPLDIDRAVATIEELCRSGIEALTVSLMHSYANPQHERTLKALVEDRFPDMPVSLSSEILPEFREYDRMITTVMNDYVRPVMRRYISRLDGRLRDSGSRSHLHIVRSDGGLMSAAAASERPVHTVLSGPAGGVISTAMIAKQTGRKSLLAFDMGGTSTDVSVILDGKPTISRSTEVGAFPAKVPALDVRSVGAGGGSIADLSDLTNSLRVGPRSAGAQPGPACYGRGGSEPTVSDANLVLGYLPRQLLGGAMELHVGAARNAVEKIAAPLRLSVEEAAQGILHIVNEKMLGALRVITVQRGLDPRDFGIVAFGGAGPLHANAMAAVLGCFPVIVPPIPGVFSALGFLQSEFKNEFVRTFIGSIAKVDPAAIAAAFADLGGQAEHWLEREGIGPERRQVRHSLDLRYEQQGYEVTVEAPADAIATGVTSEAIERFHQLHKRLYGVEFDVPVELVALRVTAIGSTPEVSAAGAAAAGVGDIDEAVVAREPAYFDHKWWHIPHYERDRLAVGAVISGPAVIRQYDSTTLVLPRHKGEIDEHKNILIWPDKAN
jgi:N-methylhydantoinase A